MSAKAEDKIKTLLALPSREGTRELDALTLQDRLDLVLASPDGRKRMNLMLLSSRPEALVQALAPEDLVLTIKDIGDEDAVSLLELSSKPQLTYLLDLEVWIQEGMDLNRLFHWLGLLFECGDPKVLHWAQSTDFELLVLLMERIILPIDREDLEQLPDVLMGRLITPDDTHHFLVKLGADFALTTQLIELIYGRDRSLFFALTGNLGTNPIAELEELALRWRNARLADRGWPDLDEALQLYQPLDPERLGPAERMPMGLDPPPRYTLQLRSADSLLAKAIAQLADEGDQALFASQTANLINRVVIGDGLVPGEIASLAQGALRMQGYLEIGLARLGAGDPESAANLLTSVPLLSIFQVAWGEILKRVVRARELATTPAGALLFLLGAPNPARMEALSSHRPLFVAPDSVVAREFSAPDDLQVLDRDLDRIQAAVTLGTALDLSQGALPDPIPSGCHPPSLDGLTFDALLLTAFARNRLALSPDISPLPLAALGDLFDGIHGGPQGLTQALQEWADANLQTTPPGLDRLVIELAHLLSEQMLTIEPGKLDPRFVEGLWLQEV